MNTKKIEAVLTWVRDAIRDHGSEITWKEATDERLRENGARGFSGGLGSMALLVVVFPTGDGAGIDGTVVLPEREIVLHLTPEVSQMAFDTIPDGIKKGA